MIDLTHVRDVLKYCLKEHFDIIRPEAVDSCQEFIDMVDNTLTVTKLA